MAQKRPEQSPENKAFSELVCYHLDRLGWNYADLSEESHISKTTICRIVSNLDHRGNTYRTSIEVVAAFAIAFQLSNEEANELFHAAFPQFQVWKEARDKHLSVTDTNALLAEKELPLLTKE